MKQCPVCKTNYSDETMSFCLTDGANLVSLPDAAETVRMSFSNNPLRINVPPESSPTVFTPPKSNQPVKKGVSPIIVGVLGFLLLLVVVGFAGLIAFIALKPSDKKDTIASVSPNPTVSQTPTPDDRTDELKEKLAILEKQVQDQKNRKNTTSVETFQTLQSSATTARANSPR
ncbi:MAG: hypothetical protein M3Q33_01000, partial [Acidobacteriota bacterium]|nr:hypothetical protein [Acidobacteriota bacterium]